MAKKKFWPQEKVIVTGGGGFLGSYVVDELQRVGCPSITVPRSREFDLRESTDIRRLLNQVNPTMIIHLAALCGGIGANLGHGGRFFYDNAIMGIQLMELARQKDVKKYVQVGTVCAYPKFTPVPFKEEDLWSGYPEETNAPYGLAKKMLLVQAQAYREQYHFNAVYLLPANLYGPRDHFDLENSHVIPALIRKIAQAQQENKDHVELWGTGKPTREFLYAQDAARGILMAAEHYNSGEPLNLGTGKPVSIRQLAELISRAMKFRGKLIWNTNRPDGQPKRGLDVRRARKALGFEAQVPLKKGLEETITWYLRHRTVSGDAVAVK